MSKCWIQAFKLRWQVGEFIVGNNATSWPKLQADSCKNLRQVNFQVGSKCGIISKKSSHTKCFVSFWTAKRLDISNVTLTDDQKFCKNKGIPLVCGIFSSPSSIAFVLWGCSRIKVIKVLLNLIHVIYDKQI